MDDFPEAVDDDKDEFPEPEEEVVDRTKKLVGMSEDKLEASWDLLLKGLNIR